MKYTKTYILMLLCFFAFSANSYALTKNELIPLHTRIHALAINSYEIYVSTPHESVESACVREKSLKKYQAEIDKIVASTDKGLTVLIMEFAIKGIISDLEKDRLLNQIKHIEYNLEFESAICGKTPETVYDSLHKLQMVEFFRQLHGIVRSEDRASVNNRFKILKYITQHKVAAIAIHVKAINMCETEIYESAIKISSIEENWTGFFEHDKSYARDTNELYTSLTDFSYDYCTRQNPETWESKRQAYIKIFKAYIKKYPLSVEARLESLKP